MTKHERLLDETLEIRAKLIAVERRLRESLAALEEMQASLRHAEERLLESMEKLAEGLDPQGM